MTDIQQLVERRERLLGPGNPLFYEEGTMMFFSDGKAAVELVIAAIADV